MREEWDCAALDGKGRRVREVKVRGRGSGSGSGSGGWSGFGEEPLFSSFERGGGEGGDGFGARRDSGVSSSSASGSRSGSSRYVDDVGGDEEDCDNDTVSPADSISQVSSSPARRLAVERGRHPQTRYTSMSSCGLEDEMRSLRMGSGGGSRISRSSKIDAGRISMANGRLVRVEAPGWA